MEKINKVMVAVDFSEYSIATVRYAATIAMTFSAEILLVNVINQKEINVIEKVILEHPAFSMEKYIQDAMKNRESQFRTIIEKSDISNLKVKTVIRIGVPYEELLKEIEEKRPNLLVMGMKGRTGLADTIIGSCAQKMFRRCLIPLLFIRNK